MEGNDEIQTSGFKSDKSTNFQRILFPTLFMLHGLFRLFSLFKAFLIITVCHDGSTPDLIPVIHTLTSTSYRIFPSTTSYLK